MSIKLKLVSCISAFILVLGIFIFGVLSAEQATVNLGGSISFDATDVYARVTGRVQNAQTNPTLQPLEFSADNDNPDQSSWSGLELQFDSQATNIIIEVTVENLSMERTLTVNLTDMIQISTDNLRKTISLDGGSYLSGANETIPVATSNDENNTSKVTFVITFDVIDHNKSLPSTTFDYDINLYDEGSVPVDYTEQGFSFYITGEGTVSLGYSREVAGSVITIPATVSLDDATGHWVTGEDYKVTSTVDLGGYYGAPIIGRNAEQIILPDTLTHIGAYAFYGCRSLISIEIPSSVISIGEYAFDECSSLQYNRDDYGVNYLGNETNNYVVLMNDDNFTGDTYQIQEGCKVIYGNSGLGAFSNNTALTSITIPASVTTIGNSAFYGCSGLTKIAIPDSVTSIGNSAFSGSGLTSVNIPEGVTTINSYTFQGCSNLTEISIPSTVTSIGFQAFYECSSLQYNRDDYGVNYLGNETNQHFALINDDSFTGNTYQILDECKVISDNAFYGCRGLTSITIPASVTTIGNDAFSYCRGLTSITIPEGVTSIGSGAFSGCSSLTLIEVNPANTTYSSEDGVVFNNDKTTLIICPEGRTESYSIPEGVTSIEGRAFYDCRGLTSITIPASVTSIGNNAFWSCVNLNNVIIDSDDIYLDLTRQSACGYLINNVDFTGDTVKVLKSVVDSVDPDSTVNTYLNGSNFTRSISEDGLYYIYTHN